MTNNKHTPGGNTTTAGVVEMARRICAAHYRARARNPKNSYGHEMAHAERLINGDSDDWDCVQTTLAAITEASELAAKLAEDLINEMRGSGNNDLRTVRHRITVALHSGDHLKGPQP